MIISDRVAIYNVDGIRSETLGTDEARYKVYRSGGDWTFVAPPPAGWDLTVPKYKVTRDLRPAQKARFRAETPFTSIWESDIWQYGERNYAAGEEIESTAWPHPSMRPLTYSAEKVLAFFIGAMKSRLPVSPWHNGQVRLSDGISGALWAPQTPQIPPFNTRPAA